MQKKFIPIIGAISAGKSTFLQGLLGTNVFETGATTTTKFVCLIKNSNLTRFYHIIPKRDEKGLEFKEDKNERETIGEDNIREKIKEINNISSNIKITKDNIFYMLEIPIKNIDNPFLLENCYFMDIPGLNENESSYIDLIFSILTLDDIKFEIMIFDSSTIGSDISLKIIKNLEEKKGLNKKGNIFILNKIDQVKEEEAINDFMQYFYQNFEDDKNKDLIPINFIENKFIPINSLLFLAETKIKEDFCSMLKVEFFNFIESKNKGQSPNSFYKYLKQKLDLELNNNNLTINLNINSITNEDYIIIEDSVKEINNMKNKLGINYSIGLRLENSETKQDMKKLFLAHKNSLLFYDNLKYFDKIKQIMKEIDKTNEDIFLIPDNNDIIININEQNNINNNINNDLNISLEELDNFLKETFKRIDPFNQLEEFKIVFQSLRENILGRKIRIPFIGNINVGKSTVLNCIIGEDILPVNDKECTYRGIIIRHAEKGNFKLYKTELKSKGKGSDEYYYFVDDKKPIREGVEEIRSYLNIKNNDKNMEDIDAYLVITGNLKIFDFIKLDGDIISKIEFIDLPGIDRENNNFNKNNYYDKILKYSNCCVYINEPQTIDDETSLAMMQNQYLKDKSKVIPELRINFIKSCLFLINKCEKIEKDEILKLINKIIKNISKVEGDEKQEDINISFFSGIKFFRYLNIINDYVYLLEKDPRKLIEKLYKKYNKNNSSPFFNMKDFKIFIYDEIDEIEEEFSLFDSQNEIEEMKLKLNIKSEIKKWEKDNYKYQLFENGDYDEISQRFYEINKKLKKIKKENIINPNDSLKFFFDLEKVIKISEEINKKNFKENIKNFFKYTDVLFDKEIIEQKEYKITAKQGELEEKIFIGETIIKKFRETENDISNIFANALSKISDTFNEEKNTISQKLRDSNKNLKVATEKFKNKINKIIQQLASDLDELFLKLYEEVRKLIDKLPRKWKEKIFLNIDTKKGLISELFSKFFISSALTLIGESLLADIITTTLGATAGGVVGGPIGIGIGFSVGLIYSITNMLIHILKKEKRYEKGLKEFKQKIEEDLCSYKDNYLETLRRYKEDFISDFKLMISTENANISHINEEDWKQIRDDYYIQKEKLLKKLEAINL